MKAGSFLIAIGNTPPDNIIIPAMPLIFEHRQLRIWSDTPALPISNRGYILGHIFTRDRPGRRITRLTETLEHRILSSRRRALLDEVWGAYVAIYVQDDGTISVIRDPSGMLPCYLQRGDGEAALASDIQTLRSSTARPVSVNFSEIAQLLSNADALARDTCISGIEELIAGECFSFSAGGMMIDSWWSPWDHIDPEARLSWTEAAEALRETAADCIRCWASCFDHVLIGVSGGLDSSIVAAASHGHAGALYCLTMVGPDPEGDERSYAHILADALNLPLDAGFYDLEHIDIHRAVAPHHPWPNSSYFAQSIETVHRSILADTPIDAFFSGNGGDNLFCSLRTASPFIDHFLAEGPRTALFSTLRDICDLTGSDASSVLRAAWDKYRRLEEGNEIPRDFSGIRPEASTKLTSIRANHPWRQAPRDTPPGKIAHIGQFLRTQRSVELYPRASFPPHIAPLVSQPLIELCLSIPSWYWIKGGLNRSLARHAFKADLPDALLRRTSKGGPSGFSHLIYEAHAAEMLDMLKHGLLVNEGIIDPAYLDEPDDPSWRGTPRRQRLMAMAAAEAWTQWWTNLSSG